MALDRSSVKIVGLVLGLGLVVGLSLGLPVSRSMAFDRSSRMLYKRQIDGTFV
jgi:hypothetical protein